MSDQTPIAIAIFAAARKGAEAVLRAEIDQRELRSYLADSGADTAGPPGLVEELAGQLITFAENVRAGA